MDATVVTLIVVAVSLPLFLTERVRYDLIALLVLVALCLGGVLEPAEAFSGFSNPAVVSIVALFVFARAFSKSGLAGLWGGSVLRIAGPSETGLLVALLLGAGMLTAFVFGAAATAVLLPIAASAARARNLPPSRVLLPLAFGTVLGGTITLIGATTNLGLQAVLLSPTLRATHPEIAPLELFELAPLGLAVFLAGSLYLATAGRKLLPSRRSEKDLAEQYRVRRFLAELRVELNSPLVGQTLAQSGLGAKEDVTILGIVRRGDAVPRPGPTTRIEAGDLLLVQGESSDLLRLRAERGLTLKEETIEGGLLGTAGLRIRETIVLPGSRLVGLTLLEIGFRAKTGLNVIALWRHGEVYPVGLKEMPLRVGDALLLQGQEEDFERLRGGEDFLLTEEVPTPPRLGFSAWISAAVFAVALALPLLGVLDLSLSLFAGAALLVLLRVLHIKEAYEAVDATLVILIVGMLALAVAFVKTNLDDAVASVLASWIPPALAPRTAIAILFAAGAALAQLARNQAAGVLLAPIAVALAVKLGMNPHALLAASLFGASCPFLTPAGHQANAMVVGPGGYKFSDFSRAGLPLLILVGAVTVVLAPLLWPS